MIVDSEVLKTRLREAFGSDSQETIGKKLNMTQGNVSKILSGSQQPTLETIYQVADTYGVSVDWLLGLSNKKRITHYSSEATYASAVETLLDLKNHGAKLDCLNNINGSYVTLQTHDELLYALMKKALGLKKMDSELFQSWVENKLSLFENKRILWDEVWKDQNIYPVINESITEAEWLIVYKEAKRIEERFQEMNEPDGVMLIEE